MPDGAAGLRPGYGADVMRLVALITTALKFWLCKIVRKIFSNEPKVANNILLENKDGRLSNDLQVFSDQKRIDSRLTSIFETIITLLSALECNEAEGFAVISLL